MTIRRARRGAAVLLVAAIALLALAVGTWATTARYAGEEYCIDHPAWPNGSWLGQSHPWHQQHYINVFGREAACGAWAADQRRSAIDGLRALGYKVEDPPPPPTHHVEASEFTFLGQGDGWGRFEFEPGNYAPRVRIRGATDADRIYLTLLPPDGFTGGEPCKVGGPLCAVRVRTFDNVEDPTAGGWTVLKVVDEDPGFWWWIVSSDIYTQRHMQPGNWYWTISAPDHVEWRVQIVPIVGKIAPWDSYWDIPGETYPGPLWEEPPW